jgi:hypothetical protein
MAQTATCSLQPLSRTRAKYVIDDSQRSVTEYCLGLPFKETRPLVPEERDRLSLWFTHARRRHLWMCALAWFSPLLLIAILASGTSFPGFAAPILMVLWMSALAVILLGSRDSRRRYRLLKKAINESEVQVFDLPGESCWLVRLPATGLIVSSTKPLEGQILAADRVAAAPSPELRYPGAGIFPGRRREVFHPSGEMEALPSRDLSPNERIELAKITSRRSMCPSTVWIGCVAYLTAVAIAGIRGQAGGIVRVVVGLVPVLIASFVGAGLARTKG